MPTPAHPAARDASHLQGLSNKRQKWTVVVAQFRGVDAAARGAAPTPPRFLRPWLVLWQSVLWLAAEACASWCSDEKSKKVVAAECGNGSRLFLVSPLALPREIVPTAWVEGELPLAADSLLGVLCVLDRSQVLVVVLHPELFLLFHVLGYVVGRLVVVGNFL